MVIEKKIQISLVILVVMFLNAMDVLGLLVVVIMQPYEVTVKQF